MKRAAITTLIEWSKKPKRKPLVMRGARQVGKSWLVRELGKTIFSNLVEINFERRPELAQLFRSNDPKIILPLLEEVLFQKIIPGKTLLFLDEIQAAPTVFQGLRYFFEDLSDLHVIAAGSLLELVLGEEAISVPVGRIEFIYIHPMNFEEFLIAHNHEGLLNRIVNWDPKKAFPESSHSQLMSLMRDYWHIGGLPEAIQSSLDNQSLSNLDEIHHAILEAYRNDFSKYRRKIDTQKLRTVFDAIPKSVGHRIKYVELAKDFRAQETESLLQLLEQARVIHRVFHTSANGVPLGAERDLNKFKLLCFDIGLQNTQLGLRKIDIQKQDPMLIHSGALAEQFVGQELIASNPNYIPSELHFWQREKKGALAEVDYIINLGSDVIPIEVKAGSSGRLRSLSTFVNEKNSRMSIQFCDKIPSINSFENSQLLTLPLYFAGQARKILEKMGPSQ